MRPKDPRKSGAARQLEAIRKQTHFTRQEAENLAALYHRLVASSSSHDLARGADPAHLQGSSALGPQRKEGLGRSAFRDMLHNTWGVVGEEVVMDRVFAALDSDSDGRLRLDEWLLGLSTLLRGTLDQATRLAFTAYDLNNDGFIVKEEMFQLLRNSLVKQPQDEDPDEGVKDLVELVLKRLDLDGDGRLSLEDFSVAVKEEPLFLEAFGQCLPTEAAARAFLATLAAGGTANVSSRNAHR